jgi:hypothetical protein
MIPVPPTSDQTIIRRLSTHRPSATKSVSQNKSRMVKRRGMGYLLSCEQPAPGLTQP